MTVKCFGCTAIHNKALYKCIIHHSFIYIYIYIYIYMYTHTHSLFYCGFGFSGQTALGPVP